MINSEESWDGDATATDARPPALGTGDRSSAMRAAASGIIDEVRTILSTAIAGGEDALQHLPDAVGERLAELEHLIDVYATRSATT